MMMIAWLILISLQSWAIADGGFDQPYFLLPPPLSEEAQAWFVKGQIEEVPFRSYFYVSPIWLDGTLEASSSWQNMTFLGFPSFDVTFEGISNLSSRHYAQAAAAPNVSDTCYSFDEIVQCTGWGLVSGAASPFYPLSVWQNNCSIRRVCGPPLVTGFMNISITCSPDNSTGLQEMFTTTEILGDGQDIISQLSWRFVHPIDPSEQPSAGCPPCQNISRTPQRSISSSTHFHLTQKRIL